MYLGIYRFAAGLLAFWFASTPLQAGITIAAAANAQFAIEEINASFRAATGTETKAVFGSSGKLCAQIRGGAPFDVFVSADMEYPDSLSAWGHADGKAAPYAYGRLVLWTTKKGFDPAQGLAAPALPGAGRIAVADPGRAPYGREAVKALKRSGVWAAAGPRLVYGESIAQVNQYILLGSVDAGITAKSAVLAEGMRGRGAWADVDSAAYDPIAQGAVVCRYGKENHPAEAGRYLAYLRSPPARAILSRYGYGLP